MDRSSGRGQWDLSGVGSKSEAGRKGHGVAWQTECKLGSCRLAWTVALTLLLGRQGGFALELGLFEAQCSYLQNGNAAPISRRLRELGDEARAWRTQALV